MVGIAGGNGQTGCSLRWDGADNIHDLGAWEFPVSTIVDCMTPDAQLVVGLARLDGDLVVHFRSRAVGFKFFTEVLSG